MSFNHGTYPELEQYRSRLISSTHSGCEVTRKRRAEKNQKSIVVVTVTVVVVVVYIDIDRYIYVYKYTRE